MLENITYKTDVEDLLTVEEVLVLFDTIEKKYSLILVSLSLYPIFNGIRNSVLISLNNQRNRELSRLLNCISTKKQEIEILLLNLKNNYNLVPTNNYLDYEQEDYEKKHIINAYEDNLNALTSKEGKIVSGVYSRLKGIKPIPETWSLRQGLEYLKLKLNIISNAHNHCFQDQVLDLWNLAEYVNM